MAAAKEFLRLSEGELHNQLCTLKTEYVDSIRRLEQEAMSFGITTLRDALLENSTTLQAELSDSRTGKYPSNWYSTSSETDSDPVAELESRSYDIRELAYQEFKKVIRKYSTSYTAKTVMTAITSTLRAPFWVFMPKTRTYHLALDGIHQQYKAQVVQPWLESLNKEGERTLLGTIKLSSDAARDSLNNALEREQTRYQRELETKRNPVDQEAVDHLVAAYVNLLAAEEALQELHGRIGSQ